MTAKLQDLLALNLYITIANKHVINKSKTSGGEELKSTHFSNIATFSHINPAL